MLACEVTGLFSMVYRVTWEPVKLERKTKICLSLICQDGDAFVCVGVRGWSLMGYFIPGHFGSGSRASWNCSAIVVVAAAVAHGVPIGDKQDNGTQSLILEPSHVSPLTQSLTHQP